MPFLINPLKGAGIPEGPNLASGEIATSPDAANALIGQCPRAAVTPLVSADGLATQLGVGQIFVKDERGRMGLGSFKALGAAHAIAKAAARRVEDGTAPDHATALAGETYVCASAGNHGLSVAAGAHVFGARAVVYLSNAVPEDFAGRLRGKGAEAVRAGDTYEASMAAAAKAAGDKGWQLLSDSSWLGYTGMPRDVMEGYLIMGDEVVRQIDRPPTHVFLQAGVGGLAAAGAATARRCWGGDVRIVVVEPEAAPALLESVRAGKPVTTQGPVSNMGRLDCKEPSQLALKYLAREADAFMTVTDDEALETGALLEKHDLATSPSGGAGIAGLRHIGAHASELGLDGSSRVLCFLSEGPVDG